MRGSRIEKTATVAPPASPLGQLGVTGAASLADTAVGGRLHPLVWPTTFLLGWVILAFSLQQLANADPLLQTAEHGHGSGGHQHHGDDHGDVGASTGGSSALAPRPVTGAGSQPTLAAGRAGIRGRVTLEPTSRAGRHAARYIRGAASTAGRPPDPIAVVYLEGTFPEVTRPFITFQMGQTHLQFDQRVLPLRRGDRVEFPNYDDTFHNVFSYSGVKAFDLGRYRPGEEPPAVTFERPGLVTVYCEIHSHMRAFLLVLESPFFAATDAEGRFELADLPPGKQVLKVWIDPQREDTFPIELVADQWLTLDLTE